MRRAKNRRESKRRRRALRVADGRKGTGGIEFVGMREQNLSHGAGIPYNNTDLEC